jgi:tetratricopeptide (TPR) repeat protein
MDRPQIEALHEKASEHYLNGRFHDAQLAWHELLSLSPEDERAVEGLRLCGLMSDSASLSHAPPAVAAKHDPVAPGRAPAAEDVEALDFDLSVLDGEVDAASREVEEPEPVGLDPLEPESTQSPLTTRHGRAAPEAAGPRAPRSEPRSAEGPPVDPVEDQLKRRVCDLLGEARQAADKGDRDEALSILSRVAILDENNEEAREMEGSLRADISRAQQEIDHWLTEGVQWIAEGRLEEAIDRFKRVLDRAPNHIEAKTYLAEAEAARSGGAAATTASHPEREGGPDRPAAQAPRSNAGVTQDDFAPAVRLDRQSVEHSPFGESSMETVPVPSAPARRGTARPLVLTVVVVAALSVAAAGWFMLDGDESASDADTAEVLAADAAPPAVANAGAASARGTVGPDSSGSPGTALGNIERAERIGTAMQRAATSRDRGDYEDAILAYNEVLSLDPDHQEARRGLLEAGEMYRSRKAIDDQFRKARIAFEDGEYGPALRLLYRLPPDSLDPAALDRYKVNGWLNLGVTALKAGDTKSALEHLGEALALKPDEPEALRLHALAESYDGIDKDRAYYVEVNRLVFRGLEDWPPE